MKRAPGAGRWLFAPARAAGPDGVIDRPECVAPYEGSRELEVPVHWTYVMEEGALPEGGQAPVYPLGVHVVVVRAGGALYAVSGKCAHMACPLSGGLLDGHVLTCPCHDWRYDLRTGRFLDAPELGLAVYPVRSDGGKLFVGLD